MPNHYNDVRTPAIWTGVIKNEDLNALARMRDLATLAAGSHQEQKAEESRGEQPDHAMGSVPISVSNRKRLKLKSFIQRQIEDLIYKAKCPKNRDSLQWRLNCAVISRLACCEVRI